MQFLRVLLTFILVGVKTSEPVLSPLVPSEDYTHVEVVNEDDPSQYQIFWKLINEDEIQFELHCKTTGWVGFGLSPNGGMAGSDFAIGWVKNNHVYLKDCYAATKSRPIEDKSQDWKLIEGAETNGYTILKFKSMLIRCDKEDREITIGTTYLIFAWNDEDPITGDNDWIYHGENRFSKVTLLLDYNSQSLQDQTVLPPDTFKYTMRMDNLPLPVKDTYYYCKLFELPTFDAPTHFIQYEIQPDSANKQNFHHISVYDCIPGFVVKPEYFIGQECGSVLLPQDLASHCMVAMCIAWGIGGKYNYTFPKDAGYPFPKTSEKRYLLFEVHYDNPRLQANKIDNSGVTMYFTKTLREHDVGLAILGNGFVKLELQIPPMTDSLTLTSICSSECTKKFFPQDGINVFSGFLHTHLAGRNVQTSIVRKDVQIGHLFDNPNYDFNYQFTINIEPLKLYKGDALITRCTFNTTDRKNFTFFGYGTYDEMCYDFVYYYPKISSFGTCVSTLPPNVIYDFYRSLMKENLIPERQLNENEYFLSQNEIADFLNNEVKTSEKLIKRYKEFFTNNNYNKSYYCGNLNQDYLFIENDFNYEPKKIIIKPDRCVSSDSTRIYYTSLMKLILLLLLNLFFF